MSIGKTRRSWWCNFRNLFFLARKWGLQDTCRWSLMFHMGPVIIPSSLMAWPCDSSIVRSLPACNDPLGRWGTSKPAVEIPVRSLTLFSRWVGVSVWTSLLLLSENWGALVSPRGSNISSEEWSLSAPHQVISSKRRPLNICPLSLCLRMSFLSVILPSLMTLGIGHNCWCVSSILCVPGCLPEKDFGCYLSAVMETDTSVSDRACWRRKLNQAMWNSSLSSVSEHQFYAKKEKTWALLCSLALHVYFNSFILWNDKW